MSDDRTPDHDPRLPEGPGDDEGQAPRFTCNVERGVHVILIDKTSTLDAYEVETLGDQIYEFLETLTAPRVVIDLSSVDHLSSAGLGMLVALRAVVERDGGVLCVANVNDELSGLLKMTKLHKVITLYNSLKEAVGSMAA